MEPVAFESILNRGKSETLITVRTGGIPKPHRITQSSRYNQQNCPILKPAHFHSVEETLH